MSEGWECPKCGKVNAPWMPSCDCHITRTGSSDKGQGER